MGSDSAASDTSSDFALPDMDSGGSDAFGNDAFGGDFGLDAGSSVPDATESVEDSAPIETFDTSGMEGVDFTPDESSTDFELGNVGGDDDAFSIPGFSDTVGTADLNKAKPDVAVADFSGAMEGPDKPKNTFTDAEYKKFQQNLADYPLNVRIAIEDLVVKNEFTDDAVFAVLEKVLRKAPVRQVASELEKMLDISLDVPRDFEKRSAEEYEAYKKSFEYQLKNRILPVAIVGTGAALVVALLFMLSWKFIVTPLKANSLYKQGYANLQQNQYVQSEDLFNQAVGYKPVKKWFFTYAEGYRDHKQYDDEGREVNNVSFAFTRNESEGTIKYFSLAYPIIDALDNGKRIVIDELDSKLHPLLVKRIVALFNDAKTNPKGAQLLFTAHDTFLLSAGLFRRDQVWFTQKNNFGATELFSLAEYKVRSTSPFERDYLLGKYGATPIIGDMEKIFNPSI